MARQQQQQQPSWLIDMRDSFNIVNFLADGHTACFRPFTREGAGPHGLGAPGFFAGAAFLPLWAGMTDSPDMLLYWQAWIIMVVYRRIMASKQEHPHYQGRVVVIGRFVKNELHARLMEAGAMWVLGGVLSGFSEDIGYFVTTGLFSFGFKYVIDSWTVARRREAARKAIVEMQAAQYEFEEERSRYG
jgi:hypothetical protein